MVHMMVGIQGSGKSTFSSILANEINAKIVSTDSVRMANPGIKEDLVWPYVYKLVAECIKNNEEVIFDATSITPKVRKRFIENVELHNVKCEIIAYFFDVDKHICAARVEKRNKEENQINIPIEVIYSYSERLVPPTLDEGFVKIKIIRDGIVCEVIEHE